MVSDEYAVLVLALEDRVVFEGVSWEEALQAHYAGGPYPGPPPGSPGSGGSWETSALRWIATLTTPNGERELEIAVPTAVAPPPAMITSVLNVVAADRWTVHHVAEDRTMEGDQIRLVAVRYLLRRSRSAGRP